MNEFDTLQSTPILTLEPFAEEVTEVVEATKEDVMAENILTPEEKAVVESFAKQIDITNSSMVLQYGAGT